MTEENFEEQIQRWLNGTLEEGEFAALQDAMRNSSSLRQRYLRLTNLDAGLRDLVLEESESDRVVDFSSGGLSQPGDTTRKSLFPALPLSIAAALVFSCLAWWLGTQFESSSERALVEGRSGEKTLGIAVLTAESGAVWKTESGTSIRKGSSLPPSRLVLEEGLAQVEFFGGASVSIEGPAELELVSRDRAILHRGRLRADVPPAARGFEVLAGEMELEDLGTSFGLSVGKGNRADLVVFDGEVRATGPEGKSLLVLGGEAAHLEAGVATTRSTSELGEFPDIDDVLAGSGDRAQVRYANWKEASLDLRRDSRLVAYYDFENLTPASRRLKNRASLGAGSDLDGGIVGARVGPGRWPGKTALDFRQEGDRVRFQIPGEFDALTLFAWVRIDALDRHLNSLFLTDYFDENEIHWQISREGKVHFATSPMGVVDIDEHNRRFYSESFWDQRNSGEWFFMATTVSRVATGDRGVVVHYVNGEPLGLSGGTQMHKPLPRMRIGGADLGNWSDPIWPEAGIRTLNGRIDEFGIFGEALSAGEIRSLYQTGKP